jgi:hypothetical protein
MSKRGEESRGAGLKDYVHSHQCAPKEWRGTHQITGHHELDAVIEQSKSAALHAKLSDYICTDEAYGPLTAYSGYRGYRGDS